MGEGHYYNPVIQSRLDTCFKLQDWKELTVYLGSLSHRDFRMAGDIIGRTLVQTEAEAFWGAFHALLTFHAKAFLGTMLKAIPLRRQTVGFTLHHGGFLLVADYLNGQGTEVDRMKFITGMLSVFEDNPEELVYLFKTLLVESPRLQMDFLLRGNSMASYYLLFLAMRQLEHDRALLVRCCGFLMKKGDTLSFNLTSMFKTYFDLQELKGTFSLCLTPYELGRLDASYELFRKAMLSI